MNIITTVSSKVEVKASIVKLRFTINKKNSDIKTAIKDLNKARAELKSFLFSKNSFTPDTYRQTNIETKKLYKQVSVKKKIGDTEKETFDNVFDTYSASTYITCELKNADSVVEDFTDIFKFITNNEILLIYEFDITDDERINAENQLIANIIDKGMHNTREIIAKSEELANMRPVLIKVDEPVSTPAVRGALHTKTQNGSYFDEDDEIFTPDMIIDIFENKTIVLSKSLVLTIDIKSPKSLA